VRHVESALAIPAFQPIEERLREFIETQLDLITKIGIQNYVQSNPVPPSSGARCPPDALGVQNALIDASRSGT
jgi:hypothetical protein